jgi:hypothetical protein
MSQKNETRWLCENAKALEKFPGQWVMFTTHNGIVETGASLDKVLRGARKSKARNRSFVFHVPSPDELAAPLL